MKRTNRPNRQDKRNTEILNRALAGEKPKIIALDYSITVGRVHQIVQKESKWVQKVD